MKQVERTKTKDNEVQSKKDRDDGRKNGKKDEKTKDALTLRHKGK